MKHIRLTAALLAALSLGTLASCQKSDTRPEPATKPSEAVVTLTYAQTYCADPWASPTSQGLEAAVKDYLLQKNILATDISSANTGTAQPCLACPCKNGMVLTVGVRPQDVAAMQAMGFVKK